MAVGDELAGVFGGHLFDQAVFVGEVLVDAFHVGHHHQPDRAEGGGQLPRDRVGVDVVAFAARADRNRGNHGDIARRRQRVQERGIDLSHPPDKADVAFGRFPLGDNQVAVFARQAHGHCALLVQVRDNAFVGLARQDHLHNLHCFSVGNTQAADKLRLFAHFVHGVADFRPAAVDDNRVDADIAHQHDVLHDGGFERFVKHRRPAVLDDNGFARVLLDIRQGLD